MDDATTKGSKTMRDTRVETTAGKIVETAGYFFDSWGKLWSVCGSDDGGAEAFGPMAVARHATINERDDLCPGDGTAWDNANNRGAIITDTNGWDWLRIWGTR